jgi:hypothetical protein
MNNKLEILTIRTGFILAGAIIAITGISYGMHSPFYIRPLVWLIAIVFVGVGLISLEWPRAFGGSPGEVPKGNQKLFLLAAIPFSFILDSQICGLGLMACTITCNVISFATIALALILVFRINQNKPVAIVLIPIVILSVIPHCICDAPINTIWHNLFNGVAPTCYIIPLVTTLFALTAMRGRRSRLSTILVVVMLIITLFIAVGNPLFGFPWEGCVGNHDMM